MLKSDLSLIGSH